MRLFLLGIVISGYTLASSARVFEPVFSMGIDNVYTNSAADSVAGVTYAETYANSRVISGSLGGRLWSWLYVALRYEYWWTRRRFTVGASEQTDTLNFQTMGLEMGYTWGNPRVLYRLTATVSSPLSLEVQSTAGSYATGLHPVTGALRGAVAIRLAGPLHLELGGGYRIVNLGDLRDAQNQSYLATPSFNLSGLFLGLAITTVL